MKTFLESAWKGRLEWFVADVLAVSSRHKGWRTRMVVSHSLSRVVCIVCHVSCNSGWSSKRCSWFSSGKDVWQHSSSHKTGWAPFSAFLVERLLWILKLCVRFCVLTYNTTLLSVAVKVRNINVDLCAHINKRLLTENIYIYLVWFTLA